MTEFLDDIETRLPEIRALTDRYEALLMIDDCHATVFMRPEGPGMTDHSGIRAHVMNGTPGKALDGAIGGYIAGSRPVIDMQRQRARLYLFFNLLTPAVVSAGIMAPGLVEKGENRRAQLFENARQWRDALTRAGCELLPGELVMGGRIALPGIPPGKPSIDWPEIVSKAITMKGVYSRAVFETWYNMIARLENGLDVRPIITHRLPVGRFRDGFGAMLSGKPGNVMLDGT